MSRSAWTELIPPSPTQRTCSGIRLMTSPTRSRSEKVPPQVLLNSVIVGINRWVYKMELQSKWARMLFYGPLLGGCMIPGSLSVTPEPTGVAALVDQAREVFLRGGARNSIEVDLPPDLPRIGADRQRIMQVLTNLLSNASKYSPDQSAIRVSASVEDVYVAISVSDEGRGVSTERLPHLFRMYSRIDSEDLGRHPAGEGLGLAICKGIVEAHGGRIRAESEGPGLGTRFTFTVPAVDEASNGSATGPGPLPADSGRAPGGRARILAVDDEPQILRLVRNTLSDAGYTMTAASVLAGAWAPSLVASAGLGVVAGLWRASARRHKAYALNPCCPACGRDLVDCWSEKTFRWSKCKGTVEVAADE